MLAHWAPGVLTGFGRALREPCGRVQWAGTETAIEWHGAIEGAVRISFFFVFVSCCFWHHCQRKPFRFGRIINVSDVVEWAEFHRAPADKNAAFCALQLLTHGGTRQRRTE